MAKLFERIPEEQELLEKIKNVSNDAVSDIFWYPFVPSSVKPGLKLKFEKLLKLFNEWESKFKEVV